MLNFVDHLDSNLDAIYLEMPGSEVVFLQGIFELHEGIGIIRTLSIQNSLVAVLTTPSMLSSCEQVLHSIHHQVPWKEVPRPQEAVDQLIMGYFKGQKPCCE